VAFVADGSALTSFHVDGQHGPQTEAVVKEFQRRAGVTDDGVAGPATLVRLGLPTSTD
jgi:peptidoglycan hydrolase-like protein with peptidoglycan-binding domain